MNTPHSISEDCNQFIFLMTFSFLPAGKVESHPMFIISNYKFKVEKDWFLSSASYVKFPLL